MAAPIILVWSSILMLARAAEIQALFFGHSESAPLFQFPVTDRVVFSRAARRLLWSSGWLGVDVFILLATVALRNEGPESLATSVLLDAVAAIGIWGAALSSAITLVWMRPRFAFGQIFVFTFVGGIVGIWVAAHKNYANPDTIRAAYNCAKWFLPSGWVCVLIEPWISGGGINPLVPLALLGTLATTTAVAARRLSAAFTFWPPHIESADAREQIPDEPPISRVSEVEEAILTRDFLSAPVWTRDGFIERAASRFLSPREHRVLDLALTSAPGWSRRYPYAFLLVLAAACIARFARDTVSQPNLIIALGIAGLGMITPVFGGNWTAFALVPIAHRATAVFNFFPVGVRELGRCILKLNLVRYLFALPCWLFGGGASAAALGSPISDGVLFAGKSWLLALALQPFFLAFKYSATTNDTSSGCLFVTALLLSALAVLAAAIAAALLSFHPDKVAPWSIAVVLLAILSWLFEAAYRRAWRSRQFDLLAKNGADEFAW